MIIKKLLKIFAKICPGNGMRVKMFRKCGYMIGNDAYIGEDMLVLDDLSETSSNLVIGDRVAISPRVTFVLYSAPNNSRIRPYVNEKKGRIIIGNDAWIGTGAVILPNVEIGEGAIVGSNAVVTKSVPDFSVVAGVPAKIINRVSVPWRVTESMNEQQSSVR